MEGSDVLLAITEVAIAFAGFTSIVGVLGRRDEASWDAEDSLRLWLMIEASLLTLFFSLLPFVLHHLSVSEPIVWGASSGAMAVTLLIHTSIVAPRLRKIYRERKWSTRRVEPFVGACIFATVAVQSLNSFGIGFDQSFGAYLLGLILLLGLASMHFVALLVAMHSVASKRDE